MPSEVRHLLFKAPEIIQAVSAHLRRAGRPLPNGFVGECTTTGDGFTAPVNFQFRFHRDVGDQGDEVSIDDVTLVAALIMHCRDNRIPLSAKAAKSLQTIGDQVCLVAKLT